MGDLFDKAKKLLAENSDTVDDVVDRIADFADQKTGGKHEQQVRDGAAKAKDAIAGFVGAEGGKKKPAGKAKPAKKAGGKSTGKPASKSAERAAGKPKASPPDTDV